MLPIPEGKRRCFFCDGTGNHCNLCGESASICECEADDWNECQSCNGTGIASADLEPAEKKTFRRQRMGTAIKCVKNKSFCQSLLERADPHAAKGLKIVNIHDIEKPGMPLIYTAMAYKLNAKDRGLMLNYCPFCGGDIQNWEKSAGKT